MNQRITKVRKKLQNGFGEAIPIGAKAENVTLNNGTILQDVIEELQTGRAGHADLTQAEYDALSQSQKNDGTIYFVADGAAGTNNAAAVRYSNSGSGLSATNVQSAIDEVNENVETQVSALKAVDATLKDAATKTVANNLVTTSQGYVLDARQGKALNDSVAALNSSTETWETFNISTAYSSSGNVDNRSFGIYNKATHLVVLSVDLYDPSAAIPKQTANILNVPSKYRPKANVTAGFTVLKSVSGSAYFERGFIDSSGYIKFNNFLTQSQAVVYMYGYVIYSV